MWTCLDEHDVAVIERCGVDFYLDVEVAEVWDLILGRGEAIDSILVVESPGGCHIDNTINILL